MILRADLRAVWNDLEKCQYEYEKRLEQLEEYHEFYEQRLRDKCFKRVHTIISHNLDDKIDELKKIIPNLSDFYYHDDIRRKEFDAYLEDLSVEKLYDILDVELSYCTGEAKCVTCKLH